MVAREVRPLSEDIAPRGQSGKSLDDIATMWCTAHTDPLTGSEDRVEVPDSCGTDHPGPEAVLIQR